MFYYQVMDSQLNESNQPTSSQEGQETIVLANDDARRELIGNILALSPAVIQQQSAIPTDDILKLPIAPLSILTVDLMDETLSPTVIHSLIAQSKAKYSRIIFLCRIKQVYMLSSYLDDSDVHIIIDDDWEGFITLISFLTTNHSTDVAEDDLQKEENDLRLLNEKVDQIAHTLAMLSKSADWRKQNGPQQNNANGVLWSGLTNPHEQSLGLIHNKPASNKENNPQYTTYNDEHSDQQSNKELAKDVRKIIRARRLREKSFPSVLFADPAWDMLLDLFVASLEEEKVAVSSLCIASSVPPTTALRWIKNLTKDGLLHREADSHDGRRIFVSLSNEAMAQMVGYFNLLRAQNFWPI